MKRQRLGLFIVLCLASLLMACGQSGKLYLPKQNQTLQSGAYDSQFASTLH